jgi:hypothetical protein
MERPAPCFEVDEESATFDLAASSSSFLFFCQIETPRREERRGLRGGKIQLVWKIV